jgi:hypothetical protein
MCSTRNRYNEASLSHALELRSAQLSAEGGADVPSRLLYAVAKGREVGLYNFNPVHP